MAKVSEATIKRIRELGMARSLKEAQGNASEEFKEGVRRFYPNAKYGPKTEKAAGTADIKDSTKAKTVQEDEPGWNWATMGNKKRGLGPPIMGAKAIQSAASRRVSSKGKGIVETAAIKAPSPTAKSSSMRGVNQSKPVLGSLPGLTATKASSERRKRVEAARRNAARRR